MTSRIGVTPSDLIAEIRDLAAAAPLDGVWKLTRRRPGGARPAIPLAVVAFLSVQRLLRGLRPSR
jgi:hypothetical protein